MLRLRPTTKLIELNGVPARVWEGETAAGVPVHAFITRVAVKEGLDDSELRAALERCPAPRDPEVASYPARLVL